MGLFGARHLAPVVDRLGKTLDTAVTLGDPPPASSDVAQASCALVDASGASAVVVVSKSKAALLQTLERIDQKTAYAALASNRNSGDFHSLPNLDQFFYWGDYRSFARHCKCNISSAKFALAQAKHPL